MSMLIALGLLARFGQWFDALSGFQQLGLGILVLCLFLVPLTIRLEILELRRQRRFHEATLRELNRRLPPPQAAGLESERRRLTAITGGRLR